MKHALAPVAGALALAAGHALADPCGAIPDRGPMPDYVKSGRVFSGPVVYVGDGDSLCVDVRGAWVEVRLADYYAPELREPGGAEAKAALSQIALGRTVTCRAGRRSYDRVVAHCTIKGTALGDLMRRSGASEGGRGYHRP